MNTALRLKASSDRIDITPPVAAEPQPAGIGSASGLMEGVAVNCTFKHDGPVDEQMRILRVEQIDGQLVGGPNHQGQSRREVTLH